MSSSLFLDDSERDGIEYNYELTFLDIEQKQEWSTHPALKGQI